MMPETSIDRVDSAVFERDYFPRDQPAVITGAMARWGAVGRWSHDYLAEKLGGKRVVVSVSKGKTSSSDSPAMDSGFWANKTDEIVEFREAVRLVGNKVASDRHCYLWRRSIPEEYPELMSDIRIPEWVPSHRPVINLWIGGANHVTPCHHDPDNNFLAQVCGHKRVTLVSPLDTRYLYPYPVDTETSNTSRVDFERPDPERFPDFHKARLSQAVLAPGEMLFIPTLWWHHVRSVDDSISVNFWWPAKIRQKMLPNELRCLPAAYGNDRLALLKSRVLAAEGRGFLDLAVMLRERGYNAAAVLFVGAQIEESVRQLCRDNDVPDRHGDLFRDLETLIGELEAGGICDGSESRELQALQGRVDRALHAPEEQFMEAGEELFSGTEVAAWIHRAGELTRALTGRKAAATPVEDDFDICL